MESHLPINPLQANLQDLTQAATNLQSDLATSAGGIAYHSDESGHRYHLGA